VRGHRLDGFVDRKATVRAGVSPACRLLMLFKRRGHFLWNQPALGLPVCTTTRIGRRYLRQNLEVTLVVAGNSHDRAGAVFHQDKIPIQIGSLSPIKRIKGVPAAKKNPTFSAVARSSVFTEAWRICASCGSASPLLRRSPRAIALPADARAPG